MITREAQKRVAQELEGQDLSRRARELYDELYPDAVPFSDFHDVLRHVRNCRANGDPLWPEDVPAAEATEEKPRKARKKTEPEATEE